ncbi:hypothetical protein FRC11_010957 [Ceratobasidium sp. 423]|nr:hypothetical protein FRC11_010957 [Ceratobasidium sp. 423]
MSIIDALNTMVRGVMPKMIGSSQVYYVSKPDLRPFEDDTWRNLDTNFQHNDTFMVVDWDLTTGDMVCPSYKVRQLPGGQFAFDSQQRSCLQCTPVTKKRGASADVQEGSRFANSLHWVAEQKCATQKVMIRVSNPFKKSEGLLASFHKALTELGLQVGIRLVDPTMETGGLSAVLWRVAQVIASSDPSNGDNSQLVRDATAVPNLEISASSPGPSESESGRDSRVVSSYSERGSRPISTREPSTTFVSTPLSWSPHATLTTTPVSPNNHMFTGQAEIQTPEIIAGPSNPSTISGSPEDEATVPSTLPPAYIDNSNTKSFPTEKRRK